MNIPYNLSFEETVRLYEAELESNPITSHLVRLLKAAKDELDEFEDQSNEISDLEYELEELKSNAFVNYDEYAHMIYAIKKQLTRIEEVIEKEQLIGIQEIINNVIDELDEAYRYL